MKLHFVMIALLLGVLTAGSAFAAAPDLLEAAKQVAEWVNQRPKTHPYDTFKALEAAIRKATGELDLGDPVVGGEDA